TSANLPGSMRVMVLGSNVTFQPLGAVAARSTLSAGALPVFVTMIGTFDCLPASALALTCSSRLVMTSCGWPEISSDKLVFALASSADTVTPIGYFLASAVEGGRTCSLMSFDWPASIGIEEICWLP